MTDFLVVIEDAPLREEDRPVTLVGINEGKRQRARVRHVRADIEEIFEEPENGEGQAVSLAVIEKEGGAQRRNDEFAESAAENHERVTKPTEEWMAGFVDDEIGEVEEEEARGIAPGVEEEEHVERNDDSAAGAGDASPVVGAVHERSVAVQPRLKELNEVGDVKEVKESAVGSWEKSQGETHGKTKGPPQTAALHCECTARSAA